MKLLKVFPIFIFYIFLVNSAMAQTNGSIQLIEAPGIRELMEKHIAYNENQKGMPGYRIQIFFDSGNNSKSRSNATKASFVAKYPDVGAYILYQEPYYKVRVGDFRTRIDAKNFFQKIQSEYQNAFIVPDEINFPNL